MRITGRFPDCPPSFSEEKLLARAGGCMGAGLIGPVGEPEKANMLEDVKCMISIRKTYSSLIHAYKMGAQNKNFGTAAMKARQSFLCRIFIRRRAQSL